MFSSIYDNLSMTTRQYAPAALAAGCTRTHNWSNARGYGNIDFDSSTAVTTHASPKRTSIPWNRLEPMTATYNGKTLLNPQSTNAIPCRNSNACYATCEAMAPCSQAGRPTPSTERVIKCRPMSAPPRNACWY